MAKQTVSLKRTLEKLFASEPDDGKLLGRLEDLTEDPTFSGLTWFWGPILYERNRNVFRSLILTRFSSWGESKPMAWKTHAKSLEAWLSQAREFQDTGIVRLLLRWKYAGKSGNIDRKLWLKVLVESYQAAPTPEARATLLDEFSDRPLLDETTAIALYSTDRAARDFILANIPRWYFLNAKVRKMWAELARLAQENGDDDMYFALYRATMPINVWANDVAELARDIADPVTLVAELERRHPVDGDTGHRPMSTLLDLLKLRGRDILPYIEAHLLGSQSETVGDIRPFIDLAEANGWWDFWAGILQHCASSLLFNASVQRALNASVSERDRLVRLKALNEAAQKRNLSQAQRAPNPLLDDVAVRLYHLHPDMLRGAFLPHIIHFQGNNYPKLLQAALDAKDAILVDVLASHYVTCAEYRHFRGPARGQENQQIKTAATLAMHYRVVRATDPDIFARRASGVLKLIPAGAIQDYPHLLRTNELTRLLFQRPFKRLLADAEAVKPLVEGANEYVQMLGCRLLASDDGRARAMAAEKLDSLLEKLLAQCQRNVRSQAFGALANAARANSTAAARVLSYAREKVDHPDARHLKTEMIALIGQILHAHPDLREAEEIPLIFELKAA